MKIGSKTISKMTELTTELYEVYADEIADAFSRFGNELKLNISIKLVADDGKISVDAGLGFIKDRVKDSMSATVDEDQMDLFEDAPDAIHGREEAKTNTNTDNEYLPTSDTKAATSTATVADKPINSTKPINPTKPTNKTSDSDFDNFDPDDNPGEEMDDDSDDF